VAKLPRVKLVSHAFPRLGAIERHIGVLENLRRIRAVVGVVGDADTGSGMDIVAFDSERFGDRGANAIG